MKKYVTSRHLRIVGKGWEVRRQLKLMTLNQPIDALLSEYTKQRPPITIKLGVPRA